MQLENLEDLQNLVLQVSTSNRNFIQLLLNHGYLSYDQLCSDILKVIHECYHAPVDRKFCTTLNSFLACYLQFVFSESKKLNSLKHEDIFNIMDFFEAMAKRFSRRISFKSVYNSALVPAEEPNFVNYTDRLKKFINHNSLNIDFDHLRLIQNSKLFDVCTNVKDSNHEDALILRNQIIESKQIFAVDNFQTFLSPLEENYTKSSKGYIYQNKIIEDYKNKLRSIIESLDDDDDDDLFNMSYESEIDGSSLTEENYDPTYDDIISRHFGMLKNLSSDSETSLNGRVSDSDSDDSITFSYYVGKCMREYGAKPVTSDIVQCCEMLRGSDSDSEDCEIFENSSGNKFMKVSSSNINYSSELDDFDLNETFNSDSLELCDEISSPLYQSFEDSLIKSSSPASNSLSQGNIQTYSAHFEGFINPCFEDDEDIIFENVLLRHINDQWERNMQDISSEPREPKKVSFLPMPNLVTVKVFEPEDDGYSFGLYLLNQVRFKSRIEEFEQIIKPYLSAKHRASIYQNYFGNI